MVIGGKSVVFSPAYGSPFVMDIDKGRRYGTIEDFRNFVKLAQSSPWLHHSGGTICEPVDVPVNKRHLDMVYSHIKYSDRGFMGSVTAESRAEDSIDMARIVFGESFVDENCVILGNVNVNSPLVWDATMTTALRAYARANQAAVIVPFILGGAMGPVTNAGAIAQSLAETMAGCALTQLERPGAPVIFGNFLSSMSLRSGSPTFGTPEPAIGSMVIGQLARRLNLPLRCSGNFTTSKLPDAHAMNEGTMSMLAAVHCGANFILHSAGFLDGLLSMSYEKFVMDADFCGALHTYLDGVKIDDNQLALDAFREVGPGSHFFGCAHTMAELRDGLLGLARSPTTSRSRNGRRRDRRMRRSAPTGAGRRRSPNTRRRRSTRRSTRRSRISWRAKRRRCRMPGTNGRIARGGPDDDCPVCSPRCFWSPRRRRPWPASRAKSVRPFYLQPGLELEQSARGQFIDPARKVLNQNDEIRQGGPDGCLDPGAALQRHQLRSGRGRDAR